LPILRRGDRHHQCRKPGRNHPLLPIAAEARQPPVSLRAARRYGEPGGQVEERRRGGRQSFSGAVSQGESRSAAGDLRGRQAWVQADDGNHHRDARTIEDLGGTTRTGMTRSAQTALVALAVLCWSNPVASQPSILFPDPQISRVRTDFEYGNYADALKGASERIDRGNLTEAELVELHKYAGLSAFYLRQRTDAERHFWALLQLDPDYL